MPKDVISKSISPEMSNATVSLLMKDKTKDFIKIEGGS